MSGNLPRIGKQDPKYGRGIHRIRTEEAMSSSLTDLERRVLLVFRDPNFRPPVLPATALELMQLSRDPTVDIAKIILLLQKEPLLTARMVRLAESALFAGRQPLQSLQSAVVRLGLTTLSDLFLQEAMNARVFRAPGYDQPMERLRRHSIATAHLSRLVAKRTTVTSDFAFLCGLLHDAGIAAAMVAMAEGGRDAKRIPFETLWPALRSTHEPCIDALGLLWKLPPEVRFVTSHHHHFVVNGQAHMLSAVICIADSLATQLGHGMEDEADTYEFINACRAVGFSPEMVQVLRGEGKDLLAAIPGLQ